MFSNPLKTQIILTLLLVIVTVIQAKKQGVAVKGGLLCDVEFHPDAKIFLFDVDRCKIILFILKYCLVPGDTDDKMGEAKSGSLGRFQVYGTTAEITAIEPEIRGMCYKKIFEKIFSFFVFFFERACEIRETADARQKNRLFWEKIIFSRVLRLILN